MAVAVGVGGLTVAAPTPGNVSVSEELLAFTNAFAEAALAGEEDEAILDEAPDEYLDPLTCDLMRNPVRLPSGQYMDLTSIRQHLLNDPKNPFTGTALSEDDLEPADELKAEIRDWLVAQRAARRAAGSGGAAASDDDASGDDSDSGSGEAEA